MTVARSINAAAVQLAPQITAAPQAPFFLPPMMRRVTPGNTSSSISGRSVVSAALSASTSTSSAVGQMNQDLLNAQAENQALMQRQAQSGGNTAPGLSSSDVIQARDEMNALLQLQIAMQRENQYFTMMSNILKTRHETLKTIIGNIR